MVDMTEEQHLAHYGIKRKSGRYPWGSGDTPQQRSVGFQTFKNELKKTGLSDPQIAAAIQDNINAGRKEGEPFLSFKTPDLRGAIANSTEIIRAENVATATKLAAKGMSNGKIAEQMGLPKSAESTVRGWLKNSQEIKDKSIQATADVLKEHLKTKPFLDVGAGTELHMGISDVKLRAAIGSLRDEGFQQHNGIKQPQLGTDKLTDLKILTKEGVTWKEARDAVRAGLLRNVTDHSDDDGLTYMSPKTLPVSVNPKRLEVRFKEDGGGKMDGIIEMRRGIEELSLGGKNYAQVRIAVGGTHFIKGMAMYADDLPPGVDLRFNTDKSAAETKNKLDALKPMNTDKDGVVDNSNPFGATTYPRMYKDGHGKEKQSPLNIVGSHGSGNIEGRWNNWADALSSQMLSKQPIVLANRQLGRAQASRQKDLDEINALTNRVVKKKLLDEFADSADAAAVHLKAAAIDRQTTAVILPMNAVRRNEIYAPNHDHGEKVVLVRHPHGGPFEIPELTVNNNNRTARRILGAAQDAVGIHHSVAEQLSGADFDGDTVLVIPNNTRAIKTRPALEGLKGFEPKRLYKIPEDDTVTKRMTKQNTQTEMGKISNLITDMTIHKANDQELTRAIRHSMVVIDAEKHSLDYKRSEQDNNISQLKEKYQGRSPSGSLKGASTLISRSSATQLIDQVKLRPASRGGPVDPKTGALVYEPTGATRIERTSRTSKRTGETIIKEKVVPKKTSGTRMGFAKDARDLLSNKKTPQPMEEVYAAHANAMKAMANEARRTAHPEHLKMPKQSPIARRLYAKEVASLEAKLQLAQRNAPIERRAQNLAGAMARARIEGSPHLDKDGIKKIKYQELEKARIATGANKVKIGSEHSPLTAREWEAIQAGAVSSSRLRAILSNADIDRVKALATPRAHTTLTPGQIARARSLTNSGRPLSEVAELLGIPRSTLSDNLAD